MISYIDPILFPDQCHIYEVAPNRYVYPIFKNGSSSLSSSARQINYRELEQVQEVEVFLRDPFERYVSGVQTYLAHLGTGYDRDTMLKVIAEFLFLNRHFALQFHWLINFARHSNAWIHFRPLEELETATEFTYNIVSRDTSLIDYFKDNSKLNYYLQLDYIVYQNFMNCKVHFGDLVAHIKRHNNHIYTEIIQRSRDLCNVLD